MTLLTDAQQHALAALLADNAAARDFAANPLNPVVARALVPLVLRALGTNASGAEIEAAYRWIFANCAGV